MTLWEMDNILNLKLFYGLEMEKLVKIAFTSLAICLPCVKSCKNMLLDKCLQRGMFGITPESYGS